MVSRLRVVFALVVGSITLTGAEFVSAQSGAEQRLAKATSISCVFTTMSRGDWKDGQAAALVLPATLKLGFEVIDTDEGTARAVGAFGPSDIIVRLSSGTLHLVQSFREGPLYTTTVFPRDTVPGRLQAVHTRHEWTPIQLPGFTSRPEQYYGDCTTAP